MIRELDLTDREIEVLRLYGELRTQKDVAAKLGITPAAVSDTLKRCAEKITRAVKTAEFAKKKGYTKLLRIQER